MAALFAVKNRARDVDTSRGEQLLLGSKIQRGKSEFAPRPRTADDSPRQRERPAQKAPCVRHVSLRDFPANYRAGNHFAAILHGGNDNDLETALGSKLLQ